MRINEAVSKVTRHRLVGDVAAMHVEAVGEMRIVEKCLAVAFVGERDDEGGVALERASVEVRATAPGMLATQ